MARPSLTEAATAWAGAQNALARNTAAVAGFADLLGPPSQRRQVAERFLQMEALVARAAAASARQLHAWRVVHRWVTEGPVGRADSVRFAMTAGRQSPRALARHIALYADVGGTISVSDPSVRIRGYAPPPVAASTVHDARRIRYA